MHPHLRAAFEALAGSTDEDRRRRFLTAIDDQPLAEALAELPIATEIEQMATWMAEEIGGLQTPESAIEEWVWTLAYSEWGGRRDSCDVELGFNDAGEETRPVASTSSGVLTRLLAIAPETGDELLLGVAALLARGAFERLDARLVGEGVPVFVESADRGGFALGAASSAGWDVEDAGYFED